MGVVLVNFATREFRSRQRLSTRSGWDVGGVDEVRSFSPSDLDRRFRRRHRSILSAGRGAGFWLWKPYLVTRELAGLGDGDWLVYADCGIVFVAAIEHLVRFAAERQLDVMPFELPFLERRNTKRDAFILLGVDEPRFTDTRQRHASFIIWRGTTAARALASEWLATATDPRASTDLDNQLGRANYPEFLDHRHDQSIFSLLTKRAGLPAFRDPSQLGDRHLDEYPESTYPRIVHHSRGRPLPVRARVEQTLVRRSRDLRAGRVLRAFSLPTLR